MRGSRTRLDERRNLYYAADRPRARVQILCCCPLAALLSYVVVKLYHAALVRIYLAKMQGDVPLEPFKK